MDQGHGPAGQVSDDGQSCEFKQLTSGGGVASKGRVGHPPGQKPDNSHAEGPGEGAIAGAERLGTDTRPGPRLPGIRRVVGAVTSPVNKERLPS